MNAFAELGERQGRQRPAPKSRRTAQGEKPTAAEAAIKEQAKLSSAYRRSRREIWKAALKGEQGKRLAELKRALRRFGPGDAAGFVAHVESLDWPRVVDLETRYLAMRVVSERIMKIRESAGLPPIDDSLPGEPDCAFVRCRAAIMGG